MGVEGLYKFITNNFTDIYETINIGEIKKKSCIIDGIQHIYTQLIYMRSKNREVISNTGLNISHIHGLLNSLIYYLKNMIVPIFIFDGRSPEIKKKKIEERRNNLKINLRKLREIRNSIKNLNNDYYISDYNSDSNSDSNNDSNIQKKIIFGTPPEQVNLEDYNIEEDTEDIPRRLSFEDNSEYHKIYKKSIILKDYFIIDWMEILELLGIPNIRAEGEADPLCSYILNKNKYIFGIISDDSDMLIFGAPRIMKKTYNQKFKVIELYKLITTIESKLRLELDYNIIFNEEDLINFSILLGTDYGSFNLKKKYDNSYELLKEYALNKKITEYIEDDELDKFNLIKQYYMKNNFDEKYIDNSLINEKPIWKKPKLMELKKRLLELDVDEEYIDEINKLFEEYYYKYSKKPNFNPNYYESTKIYKEHFNYSKPFEYINEINFDISKFYFNRNLR
jgi:5'-3' exonuclease